MTEQITDAPNRLERRKARTRAALIRAAQSFMAAGKLTAPILEITQAADVGMGSFYNHFQTKEELFHAAVEEALDRHGAILDELTADLDDPAQVFAQSFRLTGRLHRRNPELSKVLLRDAESGQLGQRPAPRARRDIEAAARAGRFSVRDPELALTITAGAHCASGNCCTTTPNVTTRRTPTKSPRTCCGCSASRPTKPTKSADAPYPTPTINPTAQPPHSVSGCGTGFAEDRAP